MKRMEQVGLPKSHILRILEKKIKKSNFQFDFIGELKRLHEIVCAQIDYISNLFPEYTPHDFKRHINNLFNIAEGISNTKRDGLLGLELIEKMNVAELFLLAASIYSHDWGMAVSNTEKEYIIDEKKPKTDENICLLPDEKARFIRFLQEKGIKTDKKEYKNEINESIWRDYVRETHPQRSGERIRHFFEKSDSGVAIAVAKICEGHGVSFETLQDDQLYPMNYSVMGNTVNIRAISLYLRLLDLFDLADNRTPFTVWKFVSPKDKNSKLEWAKHLSLRPITFSKFGKARVIRIDGETNDHEVFAALEDLHRYCKNQLESSNEILARMKDEYHELDIDHIEWKVQPKGFKPVSIRFEFDRTTMFEILSNEIYKGDHNVYLRELLQNSIDAIRLRRELLHRKGLSLSGEIGVDVTYLENGDAEIIWRDNGIGMDQYIIKNYLAVAGKSFYTSEEFVKSGFKIDPISRFGVGILSCFMVADSIEITTKKDPNLGNTTEAIRIKIPDVSKQFRVEILDMETIEVGTTVKVFINGNKLPRKKEKIIGSFEIANYLSQIAGFVEFPITVNERGRNTIIVHPKQDPTTIQKLSKRYEKTNFVIHQIDLSYPVDKIFVPQDVETARALLREECIDLKKDLKLKGFEGQISFLVPKNENIDFTKNYGFWKQINNNNPTSETILRLDEKSNRLIYSIYREGILLRDVQFFGFKDSSFPVSLKINMSKSKSPEIDIARTRVLGTSTWNEQIMHAFQKYYFKKIAKDLIEAKPGKRWLKMGRLATYYNIAFDKYTDLFPLDKWSVPIFTAGGKLKFIDWKNLLKKEIYLFPKSLGNNALEDFVLDNFFNVKYSGPLTSWEGEDCVIDGYALEENQRDMPLSWSFLYILENNFLPIAVRFLKSPYDENKILYQYKCVIRDKNIIQYPQEIFRRVLVSDGEIEEVQQIRENASSIKTISGDFSNFKYYSLMKGNLLASPRTAIEFLPPFENYFAYGKILYNFRHPLIQKFLELENWLSQNKGAVPLAKLGMLKDLRPWQNVETYSQLVKKIMQLWTVAGQLGFQISNIQNLMPTVSDFIPGSVSKTEHKLAENPFIFFHSRNFEKKLGIILPKREICLFGKPIEKVKF
jgi:hypothetical protein